MNLSQLFLSVVVAIVLIVSTEWLKEFDLEPHNHTVEPVAIEDHPKLHTTIILCGDSLQVQKDTGKHIPYEAK